MGQGNLVLRYLTAAVLIGGPSGVGFAQAKPATVPDAQIEANVLKALAGAPQLADQSISTTTVYGTVTLSGTVRDEASRNMAEQLVSNAAGVQKVVDELTIGTGTAAANDAPQAQNPNEEGTNPNLQSDGTMAPAQPAQEQSPGNVAAAPQEQVQDQQTGQGAPNGSYRRPYARPYGPPPPPAYSQQPRVEHQGAGKGANTVGNTVGLSAVGALIGAVAGGGVGAAVGAGVGGVAGLGVSSASGRGEAVIPSEAIVSFRLTQPAALTTVSQAELNRLGSGVPVGAQPQLQRRYPPPPPPPYYYGPYFGPVYYPRY